jgi:hypothetical protein
MVEILLTVDGDGKDMAHIRYSDLTTQAFQQLPRRPIMDEDCWPFQSHNAGCDEFITVTQNRSKQLQHYSILIGIMRSKEKRGVWRE